MTTVKQELCLMLEKEREMGVNSTLKEVKFQDKTDK